MEGDWCYNLELFMVYRFWYLREDVNIIYFFFERAGELRINILRRKKGERSLKCYRYDGSVTHPKNKITTLTKKEKNKTSNTRPNTLGGWNS